MPNWCTNELQVFGSEEDLATFAADAKGVEDNDLSLEKLYPTPENLDLEEGGAMPGWYTWRLANWGTKWDLDATLMTDPPFQYLTYNFDSAWSPPVEAFQVIAAKYPQLSFTLHWDEPAMDFAGVAEWVDGKLVSHEEFGSIIAAEWAENEEEEGEDLPDDD